MLINVSGSTEVSVCRMLPILHSPIRIWMIISVGGFGRILDEGIAWQEKHETNKHARRVKVPGETMIAKKRSETWPTIRYGIFEGGKGTVSSTVFPARQMCVSVKCSSLLLFTTIQIYGESKPTVS